MKNDDSPSKTEKSKTNTRSLVIFFSLTMLVVVTDCNVSSSLEIELRLFFDLQFSSHAEICENFHFSLKNRDL